MTGEQAFNLGFVKTAAFPKERLQMARKLLAPRLANKTRRLELKILTGQGNVESMRRAKRRIGSIMSRLQHDDTATHIARSAHASGSKPMATWGGLKNKALKGTGERFKATPGYVSKNVHVIDDPSLFESTVVSRKKRAV